MSSTRSIFGICRSKNGVAGLIGGDVLLHQRGNARHQVGQPDVVAIARALSELDRPVEDRGDRRAHGVPRTEEDRITGAGVERSYRDPTFA